MIPSTQLKWSNTPRHRCPVLTFLAGKANMFSKDYAIGIGFVIKVLATGKESDFGYWGLCYSLIPFCGGKV